MCGSFLSNKYLIFDQISAIYKIIKLGKDFVQQGMTHFPSLSYF